MWFNEQRFSVVHSPAPCTACGVHHGGSVVPSCWHHLQLWTEVKHFILLPPLKGRSLSVECLWNICWIEILPAVQFMLRCSFYGSFFVPLFYDEITGKCAMLNKKNISKCLITLVPFLEIILKNLESGSSHLIQDFDWPKYWPSYSFFWQSFGILAIIT